MMVKWSTKKAEYETLEIIRFRLLLGKVVTGVDITVQLEHSQFKLLMQA